MENIVERLREPAGQFGKSMLVCREAADEIEQLYHAIRLAAPAGTPAAIIVRKTLTFECAEAIYGASSSSVTTGTRK